MAYKKFCPICGTEALFNTDGTPMHDCIPLAGDVPAEAPVPEQEPTEPQKKSLLAKWFGRKG